MEEDNGAKAPVTRLRRRLSVEQSDDVKSPGPATPTKKRGGRIAAKPQLDLIVENASTPGSATRRSTRKASVKEIIEAGEKPATPLRGICSPSRRSTLIKSNTSIVSEATQPFDSPRAKRAARRTSQVGSDSESSVTPAKANRRTRKDSASSVEKLEVTLASKPSNITEVIIEETESSKSDDPTKDNKNTTEITPTRRSPRLKGKKQSEKKLTKSMEINSNSNETDLNNTLTKNEFNNSTQNVKFESVPEVPEALENKNVVSPEKPEINVFNSSLLMIKELDKKPRNKTSNLNKSTSALDSNSFKSKRQRTKSWTITSHTHVDERRFYSDNESEKKRFDKKKGLKESKNKSMHMGSGDHVLNNTENEKSTVDSIDEKSEHNLSVQKNTLTESSFSTAKARKSEELVTPTKSLNVSNSVVDAQTISPEGNKENIHTTKDDDEDNESSKFFAKAPTAILQSTVFFEDSDTDSRGKGKKIQLDTDDQCVPVVDNKLVEERVTETSDNGKRSKNNSVLNNTNDKNLAEDSCEPMDIDETIPNNISITEFSQNNFNQTCDDNMHKVQDTSTSVSHSPLIDNILNKSSNKSKRKSSITISNNQNLDKTDHENKSTLILSQIKDVSSTEHNTSKSPKGSNELLSKSVCMVSLVKDKAIDKKNISQDYSTSTPLQQKKIQKLAVQIDSSIIDTVTVESKKTNKSSKNEMSQISKSSEDTSDDDSEDEVDSSRPKNSLLEDEAEVASDDYESGDSQDDNEMEYEKNNEIVERGETLDSDDDVSNDTDYEKDSFVVSSGEEDDDLLSGSGDDLSMSDNELTMSKKSKNKYNERKLKDQKKASREMYEARHKLNASNASLKSRKSKRQKIESSEESSEEETIAPVKRNKLRLDSTQDESLNSPIANDSKLKNKSNRKRLSQSVCDENANTEHEITVYGENVQYHDPLSVQVKLEPKTPMKAMDISTVQINENIEEVCVENNVSVMKSSETVDPLQATMLEADSSLSENSEIVNNYESVLKELNDKKPMTLKTLDMSLNLNKKTKQNKQPIIDQLNITNPKKYMQNTTTVGNDVVDSTLSNKPLIKVDSCANAFEESSSSDSIDLQLLFSDSNDLDTSQKCSKNKEAQDTGEAEDFIPLKRTPGKMNILTTEPKHQYFSENIEPTESQPLNESAQNKKRKSKGPIEVKPGNETANDNDIQIIVDTLGTHESLDKSLSTTLNTSTKKKNKKNYATLNDGGLSMLNVTNNSDEDVPEEVSTKTKKKNRESSETHLKEVTTNAKDEDAPEEISYESTKSKKKNRKSSETHIEEGPSKEEAEKSLNISLNVSSAKKKKKKNSESQNEQTLEANADTTYVDTNVSLGSAKKQKNKNNNSQIAIEDERDSSEKSINFEVVTDSTKKKKKKLSITLGNEDNKTNDETPNISTGSTKKKKHKVKSGDEPMPAEETNINIIEKTSENLKKRKRKSSTNQDKDNINLEGAKPQILDDSMVSGSQKKKRKISQNDDYVQISDTDNVTNGAQNKKSKSLADSEHPKQNQDFEPKKKNKKRKERDDDDGNNISKIFKENSFDKVYITRLPASIITQLDEKPKKGVLEHKKSSVISTTPFVVEDSRKRRNKPSAFLEESVYLNDTLIVKKKKTNIKKPKVLPFIPTAVTSGTGFTTNFKINVLPQEVQFVAQSTNAANFKNDYLYGKKIKRLGTYETYKKHRSTKMSKF